MLVYLCTTFQGYVHAVFQDRACAMRFCDEHLGYHVIERELLKRGEIADEPPAPSRKSNRWDTGA